MTDNKGHYKLNVPSMQDTLVFSYIGYQAKEVPIKGRSKININLKSATFKIKQLTVVGYGKQSDETVTSSISKVEGSEISRTPTGNIGNALTGLAPGLQITQRSGKPGQTTPTIFLRGVSSLSNGNSHPIYVLDGVVMQNAQAITQLDPNTIESVSVLKDAAAAAIYGVEGANGAIVVATKRGHKGPMSISLETTAGFQAPTTWPEMTDSYTTALAYNTAQKNDGIPQSQRQFSPTVINAFKTGSNPLVYPNTNWRRYLYKNQAFQTQSNLTLSGGTDNVRYFISGGFLRQNGFYETFKSPYTFKMNPYFNRYNFRINLDVDVTPTTEISLTSGGRLGERLQTDRSSHSLRYEVLGGSPFSSPGIIDGRHIRINNTYIPSGGDYDDPLQYYFGDGYIKHSNNVLNLQLSLTQQLDALTKGLELSVKGAYNSYFTRNLTRASGTAPTFTPFFRTDLVDAPGDSSIVYRKHGSQKALGYSESFSKNRNWYVEGRIHYDRSFGKNNVEGLVLFNQRRQYYPNSYTGIPEELVQGLTRLNYNYDRRYLLQLTMNVSGSERFAKGNRFGYFPSVSAGWILTNEPYMPDWSFLDYLKLRASYGIDGSDQGVGRFLYLPSVYNTSGNGYSYGNEISEDYPGISEGALGNSQITWATSRTQNYGMDLHLFSDKLEFSFDYFREKRTGILIRKNNVPDYVSVTLPAVNAGKVENHGFESSVKWQQQFDDFSYSISGNIAFARDKILYMDEISPSEPYQAHTGQPVGQNFGYEFDGFYTQEEVGNLGNGVAKPTWPVKPGYLKYKDINGDGVINSNDQVPIGYPSQPPEYTFGSTQKFKYKGISLAMTWAAATHESRNLSRTPFRIPFGQKGRSPAMQWQWDGRWTPEKGQNATYPVFSLAAQAHRTDNSDFWLADASYIRLKNIEIAYDFGSLFLDNIGLKNLRVFANGYNLLTFSGMMNKYSIDPGQMGMASNANYPIMKIYNFGLSVKF